MQIDDYVYWVKSFIEGQSNLNAADNKNVINNL